MAHTFTFDSQLIDDYLLTAGIPLAAPTTPSPTAVYLNADGRSEVLAIHQSGELYQIVREAGSSSGWNAFGIGGALFYIAVLDAVTHWGISSISPDHQLWHFQGNGWTTQPDVTMGIFPMGLFVGIDGTLWCIDESGDVLQFDGTTWQKLSTHTQFSSLWVSGSDGDLWIIDQYNEINYVVDDSATARSLPGNARAITVSVGADGRVLALDLNGTLYQWDQNSWQTVTGTPESFSFAGSDGAGTIWAQGMGGGFHVLRAGGTWQALPAITDPSTLGIASVGVDGTLVVAAQSGRIWRLVDGPTPAWVQEVSPTGIHGFTGQGNVTEVVTGQDESGIWNALYVQSGQIYSMVYNDGYWSLPSAVAGGSSIGLTNQLDTKELIGYSVSSNGNFQVMLRSGSHGRFSAQEYPAFKNDGLLRGAFVNLTVVNDNNWYTSCVIDGALAIALGTRSAPLTSPQLQSANFVGMGNSYNDGKAMPVTMRQVVRLPWIQNQQRPYAAVLDTDGNLYMVFDMVFEIQEYIAYAGGYYNQIAGGGSTIAGIASCAATIDADGMARMYATDENGTLWVLRQTGSGGPQNNPWNWTLWHPLGNDCVHLTNGPSALSTSELFTISSDRTLSVLDQSPTTRTWTTQQIKRPAGTGEEMDRVPLYKTEITVLDTNGVAASGASVTVTPQEDVMLIVGGRAYDLAAGTSMTATSGFRGTVTLFTPATGLHTPGYTIAVDGTSQNVYPPQHARDFLAGKAMRNGVTFDRNALINATDSNGSLVPLSPGLNDNTATLAATAITTISGLQPQAPAPRMARAQRAAGSLESIWDDLWDELKDFSEDVYHAIRSGAFKVAGTTIDETTRVFSITISFVEEAGQAVLTFVVDTAEHIASALHSAFAWIGAEAETVINWLKLLVDWDAIKNVQKVIDFYLGSAIPYLRNLVNNDAKPLVNGFFSSLEGTIDDGFNTVRAFLGQQPMHGVAGNPGMGSTIQIPKSFSFSVGDLLSGTQVNWLIDKVEHVLFGSGGNGGIAPNSAVQNVWDDFWSRSSAAWGQLYDGIEELRSFILGAVKDPSDFGQLVSSDLLNALQDVVDAALVFADGLIETFLDLVTATLGAVQSVYDKPMDIPIVSSLYRDLTGDDLTAQTLFSLMMAFPLSVAYKLINGVSSELFSDADVQQITGGPVTSADMATGGLGASPLATAFQFCNAGITLLWAIYDTGLDLPKEAPPIGFQIGDIIFPFVLQVFGWPGGIPFAQPPMSTPADTWSFGSWVTGWAPIIVNTALLVIGNKAAEGSRTARYIDPVGKGILTGLGLLSLGVGAAASGLGRNDGSADGATVAANTLSPMPNLFQWLRLEAVADSTEEMTYILKPIVDFFTGAGSAVALFAERPSGIAASPAPAR